MTFFDSLKKWFYTKNSSAASSDARVPLLDASGNPKGSDTMANLASVLGALTTKGLVTTLGLTDYNNITSTGIYTVNDTLNNRPTGTASGMLIVYYRTYTVQEFFDGQNHFYRYLSNSGTWTDWHETALDFPSFYKDYATLAELITASNNGNIKTLISTEQRQEWVLKSVTLSNEGIAEIYFVPNSTTRYTALLINRVTTAGEPLLSSTLPSTLRCEKNGGSYIIGIIGNWSSIYIRMIKGTYIAENYTE